MILSRLEMFTFQPSAGGLQPQLDSLMARMSPLPILQRWNSICTCGTSARRLGNSGSLGWLRDMYYSGIQQIMRMDPEYYRCYVALRPDHHWRLISYPYYAKYAVEGDNTFFRHIDINITQYLKDGRGGNMIQGSVSLDDETPDMCTEIIPGMHTKEKIAEWYNRVKARHSAGESGS